MVAKDTFFYIKTTLNCRGILLDLSKPAVMGILNLSADSFYDGGKFSTEKKTLSRVENLLAAGCLFIDIGAASSRPGAATVSSEEEGKRLLPALKSIVKEFPKALLSIDTFRADIARQCIEAGAALINDISGGQSDENMFKTIGALQVPYILMHMQGKPKTMQANPSYSNVVLEVLDFMVQKIALLKMHGVKDILIDPGFGFGKTSAHNYALLNALPEFTILGHPVVAGFSRKSMINKVLETNPAEALNGTTVLNTMALMKGVSLLRVHDAKEAGEAIQLYNYTCIQAENASKAG